MNLLALRQIERLRQRDLFCRLLAGPVGVLRYTAHVPIELQLACLHDVWYTDWSN